MLFRKRTVIILGHRGYSEFFPENTLLSFRKAVETGADGIECDIQKTMDGCFAVIHDDQLNRTTNMRGNIREHILEDIKKADAGKGEKIPELSEFLKTLSEKTFLDLEIKEETIQTEDISSILQILKKYRNSRNLMISSFSPDLLFGFKNSGFTTALLTGRQLLTMRPFELIRLIRKIKPEFLNLPVQMFHEAGRIKSFFFLLITRLAGLKTAFWTVDQDEDLALCLPWASIIITNRVKWAIQAVRLNSDNKMVD